MRTCTQATSWHIQTHFSSSCPALAECIPSTKPLDTTSRCDCTRSQFFLANHSSNSCTGSAATFVILAFWAVLGLVCLFIAGRLWRAMPVPQPATSANPKLKGGHFQRCKWVNLTLTLWTFLWCLIRVVHLLVLQTTDTEFLVYLEFVAHSVLIFLFISLVVELAMTMVMALMFTEKLRSVNVAATPTQQMIYSALVAAFLLFLIAIAEPFHLHFISSLMFALVLLLLAFVFNRILHKLRMQHCNNAAVLSAIQQITASYKQLAAVLACCVVTAFFVALVEYVAQFGESQPALNVGRFLTSAALHVSIVVFEWRVTAIAAHIQANHRLTESHAMAILPTHSPNTITSISRTVSVADNTSVHAAILARPQMKRSLSFSRQTPTIAFDRHDVGW